MKCQLDFNGIALGALLGAALVFTVAAATGVARVADWEYRIVKGAPVAQLETALNLAAKEGWEIVNVSTDSQVGAIALARRAKRQQP